MRRPERALVARLISAAVVSIVGATSALADDYVITRPTGLYETPPTGAVQLFLQPGAGKSVTLPFPFQYFGKLYSTIGASPYGFIQFGVVPTSAGSTNQSFPTTTAAFDGVCAPVWESIRTGVLGYAGPNDAFVWTTGTAPNRHLVVSWENVAFNTLGSHGTFQVQLYETTGVIVFAYKPDTIPTTWGQFNYASGMDLPGDNRWFAVASWNQWANFPGADQQFTPRIDTFSGTLRWEPIVSDASGIGNSTMASRPLDGMRVELRRDGSTIVNVTTSASDGSFSVPAIGVATTSSGAFYVPAIQGVCTVTTQAGAVREWLVQGSLAFGSNSTLGTLTCGTSADPAGTTRASLGIAREIAVLEDWTQARTAAALGTMTVTFDDTSAASTGYQPAGASPASMTVAGAAAANYDGWDDAVVAKTYARHVLASIAALPTATADYGFGALGDEQNAFAEAFGLYLWAAATGRSVAIDGLGPSSATVCDLESPTNTSARGAKVTARVAASLFDLLDPANETVDTVDGTATSARVLQVVDAFTVAPTAGAFLQAWFNAGYDAPSITRIYIGNGVLSDDAYEPNDSPTEAPSLGNPGFVKANLLLNRVNEDWFSVTLPADAASLLADVKYDRISTGATVGVDIRDAAGTLLATGAFVGTTSVVRAETLSPKAGTYRVGVRHLGGGAVPSYLVQAYVPPTMNATPLRDWTVGRPYNFALGVRDGIPPFTLSTGPEPMPPGLGLDSASVRATGTPSAAGVYPVTIEATDSGNPANAVSRSQSVTIHEALTIAVAPFVGFPVGRAVDVALPTTGGTPPFTLGSTAGALPTGLAFDPNSFRVTGTAAAQASVALALDGVDVAGSADHVATRAVVAAEMTGRKIPADLAAGADACGWWFDAVAGSTVSFVVATAKGQVKRELAAVLLAPDRSAVAGGKFKLKPGSIAASGLVCPQSGRYYFVASSADALAATHLLGTVAVALPRSGKASFKVFPASDTTTIEVGALPGATLKLRFAGDKKTGLVARVVSVTDPAGTPFGYQAFVKSTQIGGTLRATLPTGGTWTVVLAAASSSGVAGRYAWSYSIKQPKGATYSAD